MEEQGLVQFFHDHLKLPMKKLAADSSCDFRRCSREWRGFTRKIDTLMKEVKIGLVGKYTGLEDAYASVTKALSHASIQSNLKLNLKVINYKFIFIIFFFTATITVVPSKSYLKLQV